jgi:hypothetical protein
LLLLVLRVLLLDDPAATAISLKIIMKTVLLDPVVPTRLLDGHTHNAIFRSAMYFSLRKRDDQESSSMLNV